MIISIKIIGRTTYRCAKELNWALISYIKFNQILWIGENRLELTQVFKFSKPNPDDSLPPENPHFPNLQISTINWGQVFKFRSLWGKSSLKPTLDPSEHWTQSLQYSCTVNNHLYQFHSYTETKDHLFNKLLDKLEIHMHKRGIRSFSQFIYICKLKVNKRLKLRAWKL